VPRRDAPITLLGLATHTAGLEREIGTPPRRTPHFTYPDFETRWQWLASAELKYTPGTQAFYSNIGFEILGEYLSARCAKSWQDVVADAVTGPIGMQSTGVVDLGSAASGARGSVADLMALGRELLSPTIISRSGLDSATQVAFPGLSGVVPGIGRFENCDWGLGFEIKGSKQPHWTARTSSPRTFGHFGRSGAFLWADPDAGVACAIAGGAPFGPWALEKWPELSDAVIESWATPAFRSGAETGLEEL